MSDVMRIGGRFVSMAEAIRWVQEYFTLENRGRRKPYAHPAYDDYDSGSGPFELNDGDLLAPTLLHATPTVRAFYSLQRVRPQLTEALGRIPVDLRLQDASAADSLSPLLGDLVTVLDGPHRPADVRLTTLLKVLHRKRPAFIPLYDQFVKACYVGEQVGFPVRTVPDRSTRDYAVAVAAAMRHDLLAQQPGFARLHEITPHVSLLRLLDVLAWKVGQRLPSSDPAAPDPTDATRT